MCRFFIEIATANCFGAGTDAEVWVGVSGTKGSMPERRLHQPEERAINLFERNSSHVFRFSGVGIGLVERAYVSVVPSGAGSRYEVASVLFHAWYGTHVVVGFAGGS